jgi:hypothetical protein
LPSIVYTHLGSLYEQRGMHRIEEKQQLNEQEDKVVLLLRKVPGVGVVGSLVDLALKAARTIDFYFFISKLSVAEEFPYSALPASPATSCTFVKGPAAL